MASALLSQQRLSSHIEGLMSLCCNSHCATEIHCENVCCEGSVFLKPNPFHSGGVIVGQTQHMVCAALVMSQQGHHSRFAMAMPLRGAGRDLRRSGSGNRAARLRLTCTTCRWITDFMSNRKQHVRLGKHVSGSPDH